jgi:hypothetical protein
MKPPARRSRVREFPRFFFISGVPAPALSLNWMAGTRTQSFAELTAALAVAGTIMIRNGENNTLEKMLITPLGGKIGVAADPVQIP